MLGHVDFYTQDVLKKARADACPVSLQSLQRKKWSSTIKGKQFVQRLLLPTIYSEFLSKI